MYYAPQSHRTAGLAPSYPPLATRVRGINSRAAARFRCGPLPLPPELHLAADEDRVGPAAHLPAGEGGVAALGAELRRVDCPRHTRVDDRHVRDRVRLERAAVNAEDARGVDGQLLDQLRPGQQARL